MGSAPGFIAAVALSPANCFSCRKLGISGIFALTLEWIFV
jgi:hypothetical protein